MDIGELLEEAISIHSGKGLAMEMDINPSEITRFRTNAVGMTIPKINKLLEICGCTITKKDDRNELINALLTMTDLVKESRK